MSLEENFETYLKVKYANEEKEQSTETNVLTTQVAFFVENNKLSSRTYRIWRASIINGRSPCLKSYPSLWTQRGPEI